MSQRKGQKKNSKTENPTIVEDNNELKEDKEDKEDNKKEENAPESIESAAATSITLNFPLFCVICAEVSSSCFVVAGGGGGTSKTGVPNKVCIYKLVSSTTTTNSPAKLQEYTSLETNDSIKCVALHPSNKFVAYGMGNTSQVGSFDQNGISVVKTAQTDFYPGEDSEVKCMRFTTKGTRIATGGKDGIIRLWEFPSMKLLKSSDSVEVAIDEIDIDCNDKFLVASSQGSCFLWDLNQNMKTYSQRITHDKLFRSKKVFFRGCNFSQDGKYFFIGKIVPATRSWIEKWKYNEGKKAWTLDKSTIAHRYYHHNCMSISSTGGLIVTGTLEGTIAIFKSSSLHKIMELKVHDFFVTGVTFTPDAKSVISVSADYSCKSTLVQQNMGKLSTKLMYYSIVVILVGIIVAYFYPHLLSQVTL